MTPRARYAESNSCPIFPEEYRNGLLIFDHAGSGLEQRPHLDIQDELNGQFVNSTEWGDRARALVLSPELEVWVWSDSPHVDEIAGWSGQQPTLRQWLVDKGWIQQITAKPERPKEAFEAALRRARKSRSSSLYRKIAQAVFAECVYGRDIAGIQKSDAGVVPARLMTRAQATATGKRTPDHVTEVD